MPAQLSMKAALPLVKILATASCRISKTGPWSTMCHSQDRFRTYSKTNILWICNKNHLVICPMDEELKRWLQHWTVSNILGSQVRHWHPPHEAICSYLVFALLPIHGDMSSCLLHTKLYIVYILTLPYVWLFLWLGCLIFEYFGPHGDSFLQLSFTKSL